MMSATVGLEISLRKKQRTKNPVQTVELISQAFRETFSLLSSNLKTTAHNMLLPL